MSSWKQQITSGFSLLAKGVDGMLAAGTDKVLHGLEVVADKAVDVAGRANEKLDQLAAQLLENAEAEIDLIVRKKDLLDFAVRPDNEFNTNLAGRLWKRLTEPGFQARMAGVGCSLTPVEEGFRVSQLRKLVATLERPDIDVIQIGDGTRAFLKAFVESR
jgi:hypothetical protein